MARLSEAFDGGSGPSHSAIERLWVSEDAGDYLPAEGNKADRVLAGLRALRNGRCAAPGVSELPPDHTKLRRIALELAEMLVSQRLVDEDQVADALQTLPEKPSPRVAAVPPSDAIRAARAQDRSAAVAPPDPSPAVSEEGPIFVVHGHEHGLLHEVVRVVERATSRDVVVLHEQPNAGRTILEKFEAHAASAAYAVILLTADDVGGKAGDELASRGRQNVIFELGFFFGKLGRERVAVLLSPGVEQPSDISGLVYIEIDPKGAWKHLLARELMAVGIPVSYERIP